MTRELKFLLDIVSQAREISKESFTVKLKDGVNDLVTNLDIKIENFLIKKIKEAYLSYDIVSEEGNSKHELTDNCFVIDPIDGTINFANGLPLWAIQIACRKNGKTVASVIDFPKLGETFYADKNGAFVNGEKISVKEVPVRNALYVVDGGGNSLPALENMMKHTNNFRQFYATCLSFSSLAAGRIHGVIFRADRAWDFVPGLHLAKMAGAKIVDKTNCHAAAMNKVFLDILVKETSKTH